VVLGIAVVDIGLWLGLWTFVVSLLSARSVDDMPENLPTIDLTLGEPDLPIIDTDAPLGERPLQARALAQRDADPSRQTRRLAPPGPSHETRKAARAALAVAANTAEPAERPARSEVDPKALPLVESTEEVLPDLPLDRHSAITTRGSALAVYLDGVRRVVRRGWHPTRAFGGGDPRETDLTITGSTELRVRLRADGGLDDASVLTTSGRAALDNEAVAAFARSEPFEPVPPELLDARGGLAFRIVLQLDLERARFLRVATSLLRAAWLTPAGGGALRSKPRTAVVLVTIDRDGALARTRLEQPADLDEVNRTALDLVARVGHFPPPPDSLKIGPDQAQFRASIRLYPKGSDELHVFSGAR
jgi:TonB family protein